MLNPALQAEQFGLQAQQVFEISLLRQKIRMSGLEELLILAREHGVFQL